MVVGLKTNDVANVGFFEKKVLFKGDNFFGHFYQGDFNYFFSPKIPLFFKGTKPGHQNLGTKPE